MKTGLFHIKHHHGHPGHDGFHSYHGHVEVELAPATVDEIVGSGPYDLSEPEKNPFVGALLFGVHCGLQEYRRKTSDRTRFRVTVLKMIGVIPDASPTIIAYVAARAVLNAFQLDHEVEWPQLKKEEGLFVFRK